MVDAVLMSSQGAAAGPAYRRSACVPRSVDLSFSRLVPLSVNMSRCLGLARFVLGASQKANSRLISRARGLNNRTVSRSLTGGKLFLLASPVSLVG